MPITSLPVSWAGLHLSVHPPLDMYTGFAYTDLHVTVVHPLKLVRIRCTANFETTIYLKDAIRRWENIASGGRFYDNDIDAYWPLVGRCIIEPVRSILIPGFDEVKTKCKEAGALGGVFRAQVFSSI